MVETVFAVLDGGLTGRSVEVFLLWEVFGFVCIGMVEVVGVDVKLVMMVTGV